MLQTSGQLSLILEPAHSSLRWGSWAPPPFLSAYPTLCLCKTSWGRNRAAQRLVLLPTGCASVSIRALLQPEFAARAAWDIAPPLSLQYVLSSHCHTGRSRTCQCRAEPLTGCAFTPPAPATSLLCQWLLYVLQWTAQLRRRMGWALRACMQAVLCAPCSLPCLSGAEL